MYIRKFLIIVFSFLIAILLTSIIIYRNNFSKKIEERVHYNSYSIATNARVKEDRIQIYNNDSWSDFLIKGVKLNSFTPGYARNKSIIDKNIVIKWLEQISDMNANVITIPNIQSPSFYNAIYDYNLNAEKPIYIIHEIPIDENIILKHYDAYNQELTQMLKKHIKRTIDVIHGNAFIFDTSKHHAGVYLKDISPYILGYIIGTNTNAELVTLTNIKNLDKTTYDGEYFTVDNGKPFEVFISEIMDYTTDYEIDRYNKISLLSYNCTMETDPIKHKNETNVTKNADINLENIIDKNGDKLFVSYAIHPNTYDFFDFGDIENPVYFNYLKQLKAHHSIPVIVSDIGVSSSRGMSKVDLDEGFNRGNMDEIGQGNQIVKILDFIYNAEFSGAVITQWQDDWSKSTSFNLIEDYIDISSSTYWLDVQSSDESFGIMKFLPKLDNAFYIDGNFSEWKNVKSISKEKNIKAYADTSYLYLYMNEKDLSLLNDRIYIGLDITSLSGSKEWEEQAKFPMEVDFIIDINGYNESRIVSHERYNIFNYLYKYYSHTVDKEESPPEKNSKIFSAIYLLNRKKFYFIQDNTVIYPEYYETGRLLHGKANPYGNEYNSLADFNKEGDEMEIRIPWSLLNIINPLNKYAESDFYINGIKKPIVINQIGISINYQSSSNKFITEELIYNIPSFKNVIYEEVLKRSYHIIKDYWNKI